MSENQPLCEIFRQYSDEPIVAGGIEENEVSRFAALTDDCLTEEEMEDKLNEMLQLFI